MTIRSKTPLLSELVIAGLGGLLVVAGCMTGSSGSRSSTTPMPDRCIHTVDTNHWAGRAENWGDLSTMYSVPVRRLKETNHDLANKDMLQVGDRVLIIEEP